MFSNSHKVRARSVACNGRGDFEKIKNLRFDVLWTSIDR
jgi:hypothetical protein